MDNTTLITMLPVIGLAGLLVLSAFLLVRAGIRAGDRPDDAAVTAEPATMTMLDGDIPVVVATVHNRASVPILVGLSLRRRHLPDWLAGASAVRTPRWTSRQRFRPARHTVLGVVEAGERGQWPLPLVNGERGVNVVAVIGQGRRRLRMIDRPVVWANAPATQASKPVPQHPNPQT